MSTNSSRRRRIAAVIASVLALTIVGGTYAWHNYRQHKTNDADADAIFYKARLVEKYDSTKARKWKITDPAIDKNVSVKNPGKETPDDARIYGDVYVRIQLKEFMEFYPVTQQYSTYRYMVDDAGAFIAYALKADADAYVAALEAKYGNGPHVVEQVRMYDTPATVPDADLPWFIRTMENDPNGVYGDFIVLNEIVDRATNYRTLVTGVTNARDDQQQEHQDDIDTAGVVGSTQTDNGECLYTPHQWQAGLYDWLPSPTGIVGENFFQYIQWVYGNDVILYSEWDGAPVKKWIVDDSATNTQGWVYWGSPLEPGESSTNFLEQIQLVAQPDDAFYYAIHVDMQAVSYNELGRWDTNNDASGNDAIVAALKKAGMKVTAMSISPAGISEVYFGETQQFHATLLGTVGLPQDVEWSLTGSSGGSFIDQSGVLTVGTNETGATLTVTATSKVNPAKSASITVDVTDKPIVATVSITSPAAAGLTLPQGGVQTFTAAVTGQNITQRVVWSVDDNDSVGTVITQNGELTVAMNETVGNVIKVIVTTVDVDGNGDPVTDTYTVTIN